MKKLALIMALFMTSPAWAQLATWEIFRPATPAEVLAVSPTEAKSLARLVSEVTRLTCTNPCFYHIDRLSASASQTTGSYLPAGIPTLVMTISGQRLAVVSATFGSIVIEGLSK